MSDEIKPVLTPAQWRYVRSEAVMLPHWTDATAVTWVVDYKGRRTCEFNDEYEIPLGEIPGEIAALNDALPDGDEHKITREKIAFLRQCVGGNFYPDMAEIDAAARFLDALTALLPPED